MTDYAPIQAVILTVIRLLTDTWDEQNTSEYNSKIMDAGVDRWIILNSGPVLPISAGAGSVTKTYETIIDLGRRVQGNDDEAMKEFIIDRDELFAHFEKYPKLNNTSTVKQVRLEAVGDVVPVPVDLDNNKDTVAYWWQELRLQTVVKYTVTGGEY